MHTFVHSFQFPITAEAEEDSAYLFLGGGNMYKATVKRDFTFKGKAYKKGSKIEKLSKEDMEYLNGNNPRRVSVITDIEEIIEKVVEPKKKVEKAVKKKK